MNRELHEATNQLPRGYAQTALMFATRPDWDADSLRQYMAAMPREELELAFETLVRVVSNLSHYPVSGGRSDSQMSPYPSNARDEFP